MIEDIKFNLKKKQFCEVAIKELDKLGGRLPHGMSLTALFKYAEVILMILAGYIICFDFRKKISMLINGRTSLKLR